MASPTSLSGGRSRYVDRPRLLRTLVLTAWTSFFAWLWLSGEVSRYLGPRTYWVVPFGALFLGGTAAMHLVTIRAPVPRPGLSRGDLIGTALLLAPLVAVIVVPDADLGSLASSRKSTASGVSAAEALAPPVGEPIENPSFRDITYAEESTAYADATGVTEGTKTTLVGFVDEGTDGPSGTFTLTRFYVSCCAADAIPFSVAVDPGAVDPGLEVDQWAEVQGTLTRQGDALVVVAEAVDPVEEPDDPYLY